MRRLRLLPPDSTEGWTPYAYLVYLGFFYLPFVWARPTPRDWGIALAATAIFLPLYFRAWWVGGRRLLPVAGAIALLGLALMPWNPGASCFVIYACCFLPEVGPPASA